MTGTNTKKKTAWLDDTKKPKPDEVVINGKASRY